MGTHKLAARTRSVVLFQSTLVIAGLILFSGSSHGAGVNAEDLLSPAYKACLVKANAVEPEVLQCIGEEAHVQDRRLNAAYKALMAKLEPERKKQLQDIQRNWLKYAEGNCSFWVRPGQGGTAERDMAVECDAVVRALRANELEEMTKWN